MTDTYCARAGCTKPVTSSVLCRADTDTLIRYAAESTWLLDELRKAATMQVRLGDTGTSGAGEQPLPFNSRAAAELDRFTKHLRDWQGRLADHVGQPVRYPDPYAAALWICSTIVDRGVATWVDAGHLVDAYTARWAAAEKIINRPPERWYAGRCSARVPNLPHSHMTCPCTCHTPGPGAHTCNIAGGCDTRWDKGNGSECQRELYAEARIGVLQCPACGTNHDIAKRRDFLLAEARDIQATATEAARAVIVWSDYSRGESRLVKRITEWHRRGRISQKGTVIVSGKARPTYLVGDILDLLHAEAERTQQKNAG